MSFISLALLIFGVCYLVIITERIHKTIVALCGAAVMIGLGVVSQDEAFYSHEFGVDYECRVSADRDDGDCEYRARDRSLRGLGYLGGAAGRRKAISSAGVAGPVDGWALGHARNVTTVLLMAPVTLAITK